jgi:hypothetical protein
MIFHQVGNDFPRDNVQPTLIKARAKDTTMQITDKVRATMRTWPVTVTAKDGSVIRLAHATRDEDAHLTHMVSNNEDLHFNTLKAQWVPMVPLTLENAAVRLKDNRNKNRIFVRAYHDGTKHMVVVTPDGLAVGQGAFTGSLATQFPYTGGKAKDFAIEWVRQ